jgi:hypothetical protein
MEMTTKEVAEKLGVGDGTIRELCQAGTLKARKVPNIYHPETGSWVIDVADLDEYFRLKRLPKCKELSEPDKAYLSGLCDGEGCFTSFITRKAYKTNTGKGWSYATMYFIQIIMKDELPIRWCYDTTGVGYFFMRNRQKEGWKDLYGWRVNGAPACEVVTQILPYLKAKRRQAEIFLALRDRVRAQRFYRRGTKDGHCPMSQGEWHLRQKLISEIHELNDHTGKIRRKEFIDIDKPLLTSTPPHV